MVLSAVSVPVRIPVYTVFRNLIIKIKMEINELKNFGTKYAEAWSSQKPESVAEFFSENGSLKVNDNPPAVGRAAVAKVAEGFMAAFPDIEVTMDSLIDTSDGTEFHWTLTGINSGPGGTGKKVKVSGYELWKFDNDGLILESIGSFDSEEYNRQLVSGYE